ncbi:MAG: entericidin A/B family lipoprotein [Rhodospirillales bacterium]
MTHKSIAALLLLTLLAACNTVAGAGQDLSAAGRIVTDSAEKAADSHHH